jgi:hypothetical protein
VLSATRTTGASPLHLLLAFASLLTSHAAEVQFEGFYRARLRGFDTLSLNRQDPNNEGFAAYVEHRAWLMPKFLLSDDVRMIVELKALDNVLWGNEPALYDPFLTAQLHHFEYDLQSPTSSTDETAPLLDLTLWRVYGEVHTGIGTFTFGRVPLHWGSGIWLNNGRSVSPDFADHGDTTDRLMWEHLIQEQFYLRASVDVPTERLVGENDDTTAVGLGVAYKTEDLTAGLLLQLDHRGSVDTDSFNVFTADAAGDVKLGPLNVNAEVVGQFGGGDLEGGINDTTVTAVGAVLAPELDLDRFRVGLQAGLATGDGEGGDTNFRTFTFDRDYSVGLFMFEQPMPTLASAVGAANDSNLGRDFSEVEENGSGIAVSNAIFVKPRVSYRLIDGLWVDASWLTARMAKAQELPGGVNQQRGYGNEVGLGLRYNAIPHFTVDGRGGLFLPGTVYSRELLNPNDSTDYDQPAFGFQVTGRIDF